MGHDDSRWSWGQGTGRLTRLNSRVELVVWLWQCASLHVPSGNMAIGEIPELNGGLLYSWENHQ